MKMHKLPLKKRLRYLTFHWVGECKVWWQVDDLCKGLGRWRCIHYHSRKSWGTWHFSGLGSVKCDEKLIGCVKAMVDEDAQITTHEKAEVLDISLSSDVYQTFWKTKFQYTKVSASWIPHILMSKKTRGVGCTLKISLHILKSPLELFCLRKGTFWGFTAGYHNRKQVVNWLKIPQGLSTLIFLRWSELPLRGEIRCD